MGDALVATDRHVPHHTLTRVFGRAPEGVAAEPGADGRARDALRIQSGEHLTESFVLVAEQTIARHDHVVEEELELLLGRSDLDGDQRGVEPRRLTVDDEHRQARVTGGVIGSRARDDEDRIGLVDSRDVGLGAVEPVRVTVAHRRRVESVGVRPGIRLRDRERHLCAAAEWREPALLLLVGSVPRDQLAADRRCHEQEQQRAPLRGQLLGHDGELTDTATAAAVLRWEVHRQEPMVRDRLPQLVGSLPAAHLLGVVVVAEPRREVPDRGSDHLVLGALGEVQVPLPSRGQAAASRNRVVRCTGSVSSFGMTYSPSSRMVSSVPSSVSGPIPNTSWSAPALSHAWQAMSAWSGVPATMPVPPMDARTASSVMSGRSSGHCGTQSGCGNVSWYRYTLLCRYVGRDATMSRTASSTSSRTYAAVVIITLSFTYAPTGSASPIAFLYASTTGAISSIACTENPSTPSPIRAHIA